MRVVIGVVVDEVVVGVAVVGFVAGDDTEEPWIMQFVFQEFRCRNAPSKSRIGEQKKSGKSPERSACE